MYDVISTGGKQYKVAVGDRLKVERLDGLDGTHIEFTELLMLGGGENITIGAPHLAGAKVTALIKGHGRGKKIEIIKFRRRKHYRKQAGHRQAYTELEIIGINAN